MKQIYSLKTDNRKRDLFRKLAGGGNDNLNTPYGIIASDDWWKAIDEGRIEKKKIEGVISNYRITGHNDYPLFDLVSPLGTTTWTPEGKEKLYKNGQNAIIEFINLKETKLMINVWLHA